MGFNVDSSELREDIYYELSPRLGTRGFESVITVKECDDAGYASRHGASAGFLVKRDVEFLKMLSSSYWMAFSAGLLTEDMKSSIKSLESTVIIDVKKVECVIADEVVYFIRLNK